MGCDTQFDRPVTLSKEEKILDVEKKLDGKITYNQLEKAKEKRNEADIHYKKMSDEYWAACSKKDTAEGIRNEADHRLREAREEFDKLISKWKNQE
jgi:hypothetical protein